MKKKVHMADPSQDAVVQSNTKRYIKSKDTILLQNSFGALHFALSARISYGMTLIDYRFLTCVNTL